MSAEWIRNAIAAFSVIIALGGGGLKFYSDFQDTQRTVVELKQEFGTMQKTMTAIYCSLEPNSFQCKFDGGRP